MNYHHRPGCSHHASMPMDRTNNPHRFGTCDECVAGGPSLAPRSACRAPCKHCIPPYDLAAVLTLLVDPDLDPREYRRLTTMVINQLVSRITLLEALQPVQLEQLVRAEATLTPSNGEEIDS